MPAGHTVSWRLYLESLTLHHVLFPCLMCSGSSKCWVNIAGCQLADYYYTHYPESCIQTVEEGFLREGCGGV